MQRFFGLVTRNALLILAVILVVTVFFAYQLTKLRIDTSVMQMLVEDLPAKQQYDRYKEEFGRDSDDIMVVFKAEDVFSSAVFDKIGKLTEALKSVEGVMRVVSLSTLKDELDILNEWTLEDLRRNVELTDIFVDNVVSADGRVTAVVVVLEKGYQIGPTTEAIEKVIERFRDPDKPFQVYQIGNPVIGHTITKYTERDFKTLPFFAMSVMLVVLVFCFRNLRGAVIPLTAVCLTLIWTFGLMGILNISLSMVTMIIPTLLIAVGTAYALHIMAAYFGEATREETHNEAVIKGLTRVCLPTILASTTTIVGFASLLFNKIGIVKEFAVFSCLGLFFMLVIHLTFIPAALSLFKMPRTTKAFDSKRRSWIDTFLTKVLRITMHYPGAILVFFSVITLVAAVGLFRIRVETTPISYFKGKAPIKMAFEDVHEHLYGVYPISVVLRSSRPGYFKSPEVLRQVETFQVFLNGLEGVDLAASVVDLVKFEGLFTRSFRDKARYYVLPDDPFIVEEALKNCRMLDGDASIDYFVSKDFSKINITCRTHIVSTAGFIEIEKVILDYLQNHFPKEIEFNVTGLTMAVSHSSETVTMGQIRSLGLALVFIFILLSILFVSPRVGFYAMLPNFFPVLMNFGIMGWFGIDLCVATSLIASIAIGLSVDDTIHYAFRFNQEFKKDSSRRQAMSRTTVAVGKPIVFTSLAVGLGFSVLLFSSFVPTIIFGFLMMVTATSALFGDLFILPAILLKIEMVTLWDFIARAMGKDLNGRVKLFAVMSRSLARSVVVTGFEKNFKSGDAIFRQGASDNAVYLILRGKVMVSVNKDGSEWPIMEFARGEALTEAFWAVCADGSVTVRTLEATRLLQISNRTLKRLKKHFTRTSSRSYLKLDGIHVERQATTRGALIRRFLPGKTMLYSFWLKKDAEDNETGHSYGRTRSTKHGKQLTPEKGNLLKKGICRIISNRTSILGGIFGRTFDLFKYQFNNLRDFGLHLGREFHAHVQGFGFNPDDRGLRGFADEP